MSDIIDRLKEPEAHYPGNFDTPKRANAMLSCLCQEAMEEIESLRRELAEARQEIADRKADCETGHDQDEATITELRRQLVEKHVEVKRLRQEAAERPSAAEHGEVCDQLAASQAREQKLRELIDKANGKLLAATMCHPNAVEVLVEEAYQITTKALALPQDTTTLEAMIAKAGEVMRGRCAVEIAETADMVGIIGHSDRECLQVAIRALPGVTLGDLK